MKKLEKTSSFEKKESAATNPGVQQPIDYFDFNWALEKGGDSLRAYLNVIYIYYAFLLFKFVCG